MNDKPTWPANDHWWQYTPRNLATGYLALVAAALLMISSTVELVHGNLGRNQTILAVVIDVLGLLLLIQSTNGLKTLLRRRNQSAEESQGGAGGGS